MNLSGDALHLSSNLYMSLNLLVVLDLIDAGGAGCLVFLKVISYLPL